jgi:hypothetical protein
MLANSWFPHCSGAVNVPKKLCTLLQESKLTEGLVLKTARAEHRIRIDQIYGESRKLDLLLSGESAKGRFVIGIDAMTEAQEVGRSVAEELEIRRKNNQPESQFIQALIESFAETKGDSEGAPIKILPDPYRFLSGIAATMLAAEKENADYAIFLVHELFDTIPEGSSYASLQEKELAAFAGHLNKFFYSQNEPQPDLSKDIWLDGPFKTCENLILPIDIPVYIAKVCSSPKEEKPVLSFWSNSSDPEEKYLRHYPANIPYSSETEKLRWRLQNTIVDLAEGLIPSEDYTVSDWQKLCESLVKNMRPAETDGLLYPSWSLAADGEAANMPSDARWDCNMFATHLAVAVMTLFRLEHPQKASLIRGFDKALQAGMYFSALNGLYGPGYDAEDCLCQTARIFALGRVPEFLLANPDFSPKLLKNIQEIKYEKRARLAKEKTKDSWGAEQKNHYQKVLKQFSAPHLPEPRFNLLKHSFGFIAVPEELPKKDSDIIGNIPIIKVLPESYLASYLKKRGYTVALLESSYLENCENPDDSQLQKKTLLVVNHKVIGKDGGELEKELRRLGRLCNTDFIISVYGRKPALWGTRIKGGPIKFDEKIKPGKNDYYGSAEKFLQTVMRRNMDFCWMENEFLLEKGEFKPMPSDFSEMLADEMTEKLKTRFIDQHACGVISAFDPNKTEAENFELRRGLLAFFRNRGYGVESLSVNNKNFIFVANFKECDPDDAVLEELLIKMGEIFNQSEVLSIRNGQAFRIQIKIGKKQSKSEAKNLFSAICNHQFKFRDFNNISERRGVYEFAKSTEKKFREFSADNNSFQIKEKLS